MLRPWCLLGLVAACFAAPIDDTQGTLASMDLSITVFDQHSAKSADTSKSYVIFAFDNDACVGDKATKCADLESALNAAKSMTTQDSFAKYLSHIAFGKANKDDFPDHKKDFEKAKVPLPAVLFWPAGHSRPSCKYDAEHPSGQELFNWIQAKIKDEEDDDDMLQLDEGALPAPDPALLVCQADGGPNIVLTPPSCDDLAPRGMDLIQGLLQLKGTHHPQELLQLARTASMWSPSANQNVFIGPADNSLSHDLTGSVPIVVHDLDAQGFKALASENADYQALYFYAPWCQYCGCLDGAWTDVASYLVGSARQPNLVVSKVNGDAHSDLRDALNVTVYPSFVLVNKNGTKVLGRYLGPRSTLQLVSWVNDLIVADQYPIVKETFTISQQSPSAPDVGPVYPYVGSTAFPAPLSQ